MPDPDSPHSLRPLVIISRILSGLTAGTIVFFSLIPNPFPESGRLLDKLAHAAAYGALAFLTVTGFLKAANRMKIFLATVLFCAGLGLLLEFLQSFTGRTPDFVDELFNALGALAGASLSLFLTRFLKGVNISSRQRS